MASHQHAGPGGHRYSSAASELTAQLSRHHDLERGLERMERSGHAAAAAYDDDDDDGGPVLARVVMEECREAKIRKQNKQVAISVGLSIAIIVAVIWFVVSR